MATTRAAGRAKNSAADEEFLENLYKGGELLAAGKVIEAKEYLERAHQLQPKNEKGQNLLGLTYFKLGLFDRAAEIYEALVRENPVDPTLRVNLGLVYLKTNALARAIREFETSCDLAPEHKKAHNYLGLALAQLGNYAEAREHFVAAGSDAMAQKMDRAIAGEATGLQRAPASAEIEGSEVAAERAYEPPPEVDVEVEVTEVETETVTVTEAPDSIASAATQDPGGDWGAHFAASVSDPEDVEIRFAEDEGPPAIGLERAAAPAPVPLEIVVTPEEVAIKETPSSSPLAELGRSLEVLSAPAVAPFEIRSEGVSITVQGELLTRVDGLLLSSGGVRFEPELKRFRGRSTDQSFGDGAARMMRATGQGVIVVFAPPKQVFVSLDLGDESAYFREEAVYAFEEPVMFENGRVPSEVTGDLDLVHLRGNGKVLVRLEGALRSHQIRMDRPATVPLRRLVGWFGNLTPKLLPIAQQEGGAKVEGCVELSGEGFVLFSAPIG